MEPRRHIFRHRGDPSIDVVGAFIHRFYPAGTMTDWEKPRKFILDSISDVGRILCGENEVKMRSEGTKDTVFSFATEIPKMAKSILA